jgi:hypothetical protein
MRTETECRKLPKKRLRQLLAVDPAADDEGQEPDSEDQAGDGKFEIEVVGQGKFARDGLQGLKPLFAALHLRGGLSSMQLDSEATCRWRDKG